MEGMVETVETVAIGFYFTEMPIHTTYLLALEAVGEGTVETVDTVAAYTIRSITIRAVLPHYSEEVAVVEDMAVTEEMPDRSALYVMANLVKVTELGGLAMHNLAAVEEDTEKLQHQYVVR